MKEYMLNFQSSSFKIEVTNNDTIIFYPINEIWCMNEVIEVMKEKIIKFNYVDKEKKSFFVMLEKIQLYVIEDWKIYFKHDGDKIIITEKIECKGKFSQFSQAQEIYFNEEKNNCNGILNDITPLIPVNNKITWGEIKKFLENKDEKFLGNVAVAFDTHIDGEVPILGFLGDKLIVNS